MCRGVWNSPFLYLFHPLYQTTLFYKNKHTHHLQIMFFKNKHNAKYPTSLNTTIFLTSKSYGGIKLVWIWRISTWLKLFKYINLNQNKIIISALMHNTRTHPLYFWYTLYTQTPFLTVKPINPPFYPFSDLFKPTLSKTWVAHYALVLMISGCDNFLSSWLSSRASLAIKLLAQTCLNKKTVCVKLKSHCMLMVCT